VGRGHGQWPGRVLVDCAWPNGACRLEVDIYRWTSGIYRDDLCLNVVTDQGREVIFVNVSNELKKAEDWAKALTVSLRQLARKIDMTRVAALAISNQRESFAQFDRHDRALRPGTLWLDERAPAEARELAAKIGAERIRAISGKPSDVTPCISRCAWFARHMPGLWKKTAMTAEVHGVLTHFLTGHWHTSTASADPMGLIDMARYDWSDELISAVGLTRDQLPKLFRPGEVMGEVTAEAAKATGLKPGTPVIAGGGDGQCAGTGTNIFVKGRAYVNIGTACVSGSAGSRYAHAQAFRTLTTVAEDGYIYETCLRTGTFLINWTVETLFNAKGSPALFKALEAEAAAAPVGANGIVVMPHWSGSMTPRSPVRHSTCSRGRTSTCAVPMR